MVGASDLISAAVVVVVVVVVACVVVEEPQLVKPQQRRPRGGRSPAEGEERVPNPREKLLQENPWRLTCYCC